MFHGTQTMPAERAVEEESHLRPPRAVVLIPCHNEEFTISETVEQFHHYLPEAAVYVFDNNSTDQTVERARAAGAHVFYERRQGKGYVVQAMFREVDADVYVMVDGDGTYPASAVRDLVEPILRKEADMVVGSRWHGRSGSEAKFLNRVGNRFFLFVLNLVFRVRLTDVLSGYRAFNRDFVKGVPLYGGGFEIETELTIKAIERRYRIVEVPIEVSGRRSRSHSKVRVFRDGFIILNTILALFRDYKPLTFFGLAGLALSACGLLAGAIGVVGLAQREVVSTLPAVVLSVDLSLAGMLAMAIGLILHTITRRAQESDHQLRILLDELRLRRNRNGSDDE